MNVMNTRLQDLSYKYLFNWSVRQYHVSRWLIIFVWIFDKTFLLILIYFIYLRFHNNLIKRRSLQCSIVWFVYSHEERILRKKMEISYERPQTFVLLGKETCSSAHQKSQSHKDLACWTYYYKNFFVLYNFPSHFLFFAPLFLI